jgi:hypothetical protein
MSTARAFASVQIPSILRKVSYINPSDLIAPRHHRISEIRNVKLPQSCLFDNSNLKMSILRSVLFSVGHFLGFVDLPENLPLQQWDSEFVLSLL